MAPREKVTAKGAGASDPQGGPGQPVEPVAVAHVAPDVFVRLRCLEFACGITARRAIPPTPTDVIVQAKEFESYATTGQGPTAPGAA